MRFAMRRVLLISDSADEREMYAESFRRRGYSTLQATNAADGLRLAEELSPAVVITDSRLEGRHDGLDLATRLANAALESRPRVVVVSGSILQPDGGTAAGCDLFISKPCLPDELIEAVERLLRPRGGTGRGGARLS